MIHVVIKQSILIVIYATINSALLILHMNCKESEKQKKKRKKKITNNLKKSFEIIMVCNRYVFLRLSKCNDGK